MSKKPYIKPRVSEVIISSRVLRMIDRKGFLEIFYDDLRAKRQENPKISEREVFDSINQEYYEAFSKYRYSDYNSFKQLKK
jgi:hypothetical protein